MDEKGPSVKSFMMDFMSKELDNFLHRNPSVAELLKKRIVDIYLIDLKFGKILLGGDCQKYFLKN